MTSVEIIHLRMAVNSPGDLTDVIGASLAAESEEGAVTVYQRVGLETDLAVHVLHGSSSGGEGMSPLGLRLASALRAYGLVEHTLWEAVK